MAAVMSNEINNTDKISIFVAECERLGISILAPDVNRSGLKFVPEEVNVEGIAALQKSRKAPVVAVEGAEPQLEADVEGFALAESESIDLSVGSIRYGLAAIKNVGEAAMEAAVAERGEHGVFKSIEDFCGRVDTK